MYELKAIQDLDIHISDGNYSSKYPRSNEFVEAGVPFIRANNLLEKTISPRDMYFISPEKHTDLKKGHLRENDVLITTRGNLGTTAIVPEAYEDANINAQLVLLRANPQSIDPHFLLRCFDIHLVKSQITRLQTGTALKQLPIKRLVKIEIPLPPLAEQKRIAAILDKADALRTKRRAALAKLDTLLQSTFLEMFGDPVTNPMGWEESRFSDCILGKANNGFFAKSDNYDEDGTPIIWISDFLDRFYAQVEGLKRVKTRTKDIEKNRVDYGDVLFCRSSLTPVGIGKASIIPPNLPEETIFECHIIRCTLNQNLLLPEYFREYSDTQYFRGQVLRNAKTATMTTISQKGIVDNNVLLPPIVLQQKFKEFSKRILVYKREHEASLTQLDNLFHALQQRAFKGEL